MRNGLDIKTLSDVKEKVKHEKRTHCLVLNKYKVNDLLKNKDAKIWFLNVFRFPSVLKPREYQGCLIEAGHYDGEVLRFIHSYVERLGGGGDQVSAKANGKMCGQLPDQVSDKLSNQVKEQMTCQMTRQMTNHTNDSQTDASLADSSVADYRLIPLNARFNRALQELMQREGKDVVEGVDMRPEEGDEQDGVAEEDNAADGAASEGEGETPRGPKDALSPPLDKLFRVIKREGIQVRIIQLQFGYENMNTSEILRKVFPSESEVIHKYEMVGHIAHINFCERFENHKKIIAEIILDKNKSIRSVINKKDPLNNVHRTFNIELLAGEKNYLTMLKENDIKVKLNYELIYWNSKLKKERDRIYDLVEKNSIIVDLFAGVGIFSLHLSKKNCLCFSNDINLHAYNFMNVNIKLNKRKSILTYNLDARTFVQMLLRLDIFSCNTSTLTMELSEQNWRNISLDFVNSADDNHADSGKRKNRGSDPDCHVNDTPPADAAHDEKKKHTHGDANGPLGERRPVGLADTHTGEEVHPERTKKDEEKTIEEAPTNETHKVDINLSLYGDVHVLMNLPQTAFEFLDVFRELLHLYSTDQKDPQGRCRRDQMRNIFIHCYFFSKPELFYEHAERNIRMQLRGLPREMKITEIRKVSPSKLMYVAEFNLKEVFSQGVQFD
ncbi:tRNA wybutosine-synthesizing protein 2 [Plasmodium inui San Antonio 1]|uniref:tRNA (guanine(37)-N1)-methyltransferase n=1 Tax=Plasmodium inui San Antonio 1 TaxID=1237626 RepID=W7AR79_9APIC|nr:tRNA wybutosine-synthesizing protein 2 [Plasmodium inui San Antonio 1]EUD67966.1 tRNA wybutosine-synthesizing protein 2 [Plasmodium inui San Antonio 1]